MYVQIKNDRWSRGAPGTTPLGPGTWGRRGDASPSDVASARARPAPEAEVPVVPIHTARHRRARVGNRVAAARAAHPSMWQPPDSRVDGARRT